MESQRRHHLHSPVRRGIYSFGLIIGIMLIGTIGMHLIERLSYIDAFYFMSMIATAQGSTYAPVTTLGKIFASLMAFISVGCAVTALAFLFGPFFGKLWRIGVVKLEDELQSLRHNKDASSQ